MMLLRLPLSNQVSLSTTVRTEIVMVQMHERITIPRCILRKVHSVTGKYKRLMTEWGFRELPGCCRQIELHVSCSAANAMLDPISPTVARIVADLALERKAHMKLILFGYGSAVLP